MGGSLLIKITKYCTYHAKVRIKTLTGIIDVKNVFLNVFLITFLTFYFIFQTNESVQIQLAQCWFRGLAISGAKI